MGGRVKPGHDGGEVGARRIVGFGGRALGGTTTVLHTSAALPRRDRGKHLPWQRFAATLRAMKTAGALCCITGSIIIR